jgi:hypothetical protein
MDKQVAEHIKGYENNRIGLFKNYNMKIKNRKKVETISYTIDYENGVKCQVELKNGKLDQYRFIPNFQTTSGKYTFLYYCPDKEGLMKTHWSEHYKLLYDGKKLKYPLTLEDLHGFKEFDNLFYIGGGNDGMLRDYMGNNITSLIRVDYTHNKIYSKIKDKKTSDIFKNKADKNPYVLECKVVEIPWYNSGDYGDEDYSTHSVEYSILLPQKLFDKFMGESKYVDEQVKKKITEYILKSK